MPEWAHAARPGQKAEIYRALYRAASAEWTARGLPGACITLLGHDDEARETWFWNGFGLAVVDAVRPATALAELPSLVGRRSAGRPQPTRTLLAELDAEHVGHYAAPPVFMALPARDGAAAFAEFLALPKNSVWLALDGETPAGSCGSPAMTSMRLPCCSRTTAAFCNGAYVRPGTAASQREQRCSQAALYALCEPWAWTALYTNFESFNPEAASFWPRYFRAGVPVADAECCMRSRARRVIWATDGL